MEQIVFRYFSHFSLNFLRQAVCYSLAIILLSCFQPIIIYAQAQEPRALTVTQPVLREMSGDQAHLYQLTAEAGFFLHAVVEQKGIDVAVTLFDPTGVKALEVDSPNGTEGLEPIFFLTKLSGTYRLEVRSLAKDAAGKYEIEVKELRPAVAQDSIFINAHQLFAGGLNDYRAVGTLESRKAGIVKFAEVIPLWQQLGNTAKEAASVNYLGEIYYSLAEFPKALSYFNQSLLLSQTANDRVLEGNILNNIALTYYTTGETQKSLEYYLPALTLLRATGDRGSEAVTLSNIGLVYDRLGEKQQALDYFSQALPLRREAKDPFGEAYTLASLGSLYSSLGETDKALDYFEKSLQIRRAVKDLRGEGVTLNNIGLVYDALDDLPKALDYYNQALLIHKKTGAIGSEAATLKNLGGVYTRSGDTPKALENLHQSLAICQKIGERRGEAVVFNNLGKLYNKLADAPTALNYFTQALAIVRSIGEKTAEIEIEYNIAQLQGKLGNLQQAVAGIQRAIRLVESLRTKVEMQQLRAAYFAALIKPYELYTDLLMRLHRQDPTKNYLAAAMQVNDQAKARTLLESLSEANADIRQGIDATLLKQERELKTQLNSKAYQVTRLLSSKASEEKKELGRTELETISNQLQEMEAKIRQTNPKYAALTQPQALSVADLQQQVLDADALLLEYALGDERSYLFAITKDSIKAFDLPKRAEIETLAKQFYEHLTARNKTVKFETLAERQQRLAQADAELPSTAAALSQMILAPVAAELKNQRLLVVNDGALQYIPFAALPLPEKTHVKASLLGVSNEIVYLPSASTLAVVRREIYHRQPAPKTIAVFADPIFDKNDERLTAAKAHKKRAAQVLAQARNRANRRSDSAAPNAAASQSQTNTTTASKSQPNTTTAKPETRSASTTSTASEKMPKPESEKTSIRESEKMPKPESEKTSTRESESPPKRESDVTRAAREVGLESDGMALPRMPFTRLEAQAILRLVPASQHKVAIDFEANKTTALSQELEQYRYVHFATHGFLNTAHPELSGIVLSLIDSEGNEADGFLRAHEIYNLKLPAELVVLSGCRTGLGKEIRGEGLMGLTRGFMYAGAARVLVSLWDVDDEATAALMSRFYQAMLGKEKFSPAAALRAAQASMAKNRRWSSPYYWAAFVLQGEPK